MCGIPQSSRVIVTLAASRDQRARSADEGVGDCAEAVEASAAQRRTSLLKYLVISEGMAAKTCMSSNQYIAPITERGAWTTTSAPRARAQAAAGVSLANINPLTRPRRRTRHIQ